MNDLRAVGKIALCEVARRFDEARADTFAYFAASLRVRGAMLQSLKVGGSAARVERAMAAAVAERMADYDDDYDVLRDDASEIERRVDRFVENAAAVMFATGAEAARREADADPDPIAGREEYARSLLALRELKDGLKPDESALLDMLFERGFDLHAAADQLGVDRQTAWRRLQRLLASLRRDLEARFIREAPCPRNEVPIPQIPGLRLVKR